MNRIIAIIIKVVLLIVVYFALNSFLDNTIIKQEALNQLMNTDLDANRFNVLLELRNHSYVIPIVLAIALFVDDVKYYMIGEI